MASIKLRLREIEKLAHNQTGLAPVVQQDCLALQLRFVIEAVYQSCIAAQFDHAAPGGSRSRKEWNPKVIRSMFRQKPTFFPMSVEEYGVGEFRSVAGKYLSEADVYSMYVFCGDMLHHKSLYKGSPFETQYTEQFWDRYEPFVNGTIQLLRLHSNFVLQPDGTGVVFLCEMGWPDEISPPRVVRAVSGGPLNFTPENQAGAKVLKSEK